MTAANSVQYSFSYKELFAFDRLKFSPIDTDASVIRMMQDYIHHCGEVNKTFENGNTALHYAVLRCKVNPIKALHACGANWDIENDNNQTPRSLLDHLPEPAHKRITEFMRRRENQKDWVAIFYNCDPQTIYEELKATPIAALVEWRGEDNESLLHLAIESGFVQELHAVIPVNHFSFALSCTQLEESIVFRSNS